MNVALQKRQRLREGGAWGVTRTLARDEVGAQKETPLAGRRPGDAITGGVSDVIVGAVGRFVKPEHCLSWGR